ncbi:DUF397 domain-containing protein [Nonomuraea lactucae]|uniref:DUF397 domain-containing protein n=1 Tax=Nonomuraea lactucae TaxID=2249762 RepID=UPI000DE3EECA|nr:DUF397 domain-containing protein [Nonomuraea lactucae]
MTQVKPTPESFDLSAVQWIGSTDRPSDDPVQVAFIGENVLMRNGADAGSVLVFTQAEWEAFVAGAMDGEFDY